MSPMIKSAINRFAKGFLAGGIAQVVLIINAGTTINSIADIKAITTAVFIGFLTGGLLAVQKMISWKE